LFGTFPMFAFAKLILWRNHLGNSRSMPPGAAGWRHLFRRQRDSSTLSPARSVQAGLRYFTNTLTTERGGWRRVAPPWKVLSMRSWRAGEPPEVSLMLP